jgi:drug/metabolite transporter (DMT)-like permease
MEREKVFIVLSFLAIYFIWGSTYLFNYFAIESIPPFFMSGSRFLTAGFILYVFARMVGNKPPTFQEIKTSFFAGFLLLSMGTGSMVWAEQYIDTGMVALLAAFQPVMIVIMMWLWKSRKPGFRVIFGLTLGIAGMLLLVGQDEFTSGPDAIKGLVAILVALLAWSTGVILINGWPRPASPNMNVSVQMIGGGLWLLIFSAIVGEYGELNWGKIDDRALYSWIYLVSFGSLIGYTAFNYLLTRVTPDKVATSNYINPVVAMVLGAMYNNEIITSRSVWAAIILVSGVFFINASFKIKPPFGNLKKLAGNAKNKEIELM